MGHHVVSRTGMAIWVCWLPVTAGVGLAAGPVSDTEPNDSINEAVPTGLVDTGVVEIAGGVIGNGVLTFDRDFFSFEVSPEADLPLLFTAEMSAGDEELDAYVRLFDATGHELWNNNDVDYPDDVDARLQTYIVAPGTYYVGTSSAERPIYDPIDPKIFKHVNLPPHAYSLLLSLADGPVPDSSLEPNDQTATPIEGVPALIEDQFIGDGPNGWYDADHYWLTVDQPSIVTAEVRPVGDQLLDPVLVAALPSVLPGGVEYPADNFRPDRAARRLRAAVLEPGSIVISVRGRVPDENDLNGVGFYDLAIDVAGVATPHGSLEPNDSVLQATPTGLAGPGSAQLTASIGDGLFAELRGDADFFEVPVALDEQLVATVEPTAGPAGLLPVVHLFDYFGLHLGMFTPDASGVVHATYAGRCPDFAPEDEEDPPIPEIVYVVVTGARDRVTADPLLPLPDDTPNPAPPPLLVLHDLDGGPGSTGDYEVTLSIESALGCDASATDAIAMGGPPGPPLVTDDGAFACLAGGIYDGPCSPPEDNVDLYHVRVDDPPRVVAATLTLYECAALRMLRLFRLDGTELAAADPADELGAPAYPLNAGVRVEIDEPGDYFVGVSDAGNDAYDPLQECSGSGEAEDTEFERDSYELRFRVFSPEPAPGEPDAQPPDPATQRVFATSLDFFNDQIVELDRVTGGVLNSFAAPEPPLGGGEGLAYDGAELFAMGGDARYPFLYVLDPDTGEVLGSLLTWFGSGVYGGMTVIGDVVYLVDVLESAVYTLPADLHGPVDRLDIAATNAVALFGSLASSSGLPRLLAPDASDPSFVYELDPMTGALTGSVALGAPCPCNADFDGDGDVDKDDIAAYDACDGEGVVGTWFGCRQADLNCDGEINPHDFAVLGCQFAGSGVPPGTGCCPDDFPTVAARATGLATAGPNLLLASDWTVPELRTFNRVGTPLGAVQIDHPVGAATGVSYAGGDGDVDGDIDLLDFAALQRCFAHGSPQDECVFFDFDFNGDIDLNDYDVFQAIFTGAMP